jgi:hypothetical protein
MPVGDVQTIQRNLFLRLDLIMSKVEIEIYLPWIL